MKLIFIWFVLFQAIQARLFDDSPNVKTVLFKPADLNKNCWNQREVSLLTIRKSMQALVPKNLPNDLTRLLKYLKTVQEITESDCSDSEDEANILIRLGIADTIGGYLQSVALPIAKESYYSGRLNYDTISQLQDMLDDMKVKLGTNGASWSRQIDARKFNKKVSALDITVGSVCTCNAIFLDNCPENKPKIPLPYFDDDKRPSAIALPLKSRNLYPLKGPSSTQVLLKYYTLSVNCLKNFTDKDLMTFNRALHVWITDKVYPRLYDNEEWYAGFAGVLQILETMRQKGLISQLYPVIVDNRNLTTLETSLSKRECCNDGRHSYEYYLLPLEFLFFIILLLCCFWIYVYAKIKDRKSHDVDVKDSEMADALLSFYCGLKEAKTQDVGRYQQGDDDMNNVVLKPTVGKTPGKDMESPTDEDKLCWCHQTQDIRDKDGKSEVRRLYPSNRQESPAEKCECRPIDARCSNTQLLKDESKTSQSDKEVRLGKSNVEVNKRITRTPYTIPLTERQPNPSRTRQIVDSDEETSREAETSAEED